MAPARRLRMRQWLSVLLDGGETQGMQWEDRSNSVFRINWKHGSRHGYSADTDAVVFRKWAEYTGKLDARGSPDPKRWKANFRCALNSLKDVRQLSGKYNRGVHAFRLYQFIDHAPHSNTQPIKRELFAEGKTPAYQHYDEYPKMAANQTFIKVEARDECDVSSRGVEEDVGRCYMLTPPLTPEEASNKHNLNDHNTHYAFTPSPGSFTSTSTNSTSSYDSLPPVLLPVAKVENEDVPTMGIAHLITDFELSTMDYNKELEGFDGFDKYEFQENGMVIDDRST